MTNPFNVSEQKAVMHYVFKIADTDANLNDNGRAMITLLGLKFGYSQRDLTDAVLISDSTASTTLIAMNNEKKRLAANLFSAAAMADGNLSFTRPESRACLSILKQCQLPLDINPRDSLLVANQFLKG